MGFELTPDIHPLIMSTVAAPFIQQLLQVLAIVRVYLSVYSRLRGLRAQAQRELLTY